MNTPKSKEELDQLRYDILAELNWLSPGSAPHRKGGSVSRLLQLFTYTTRHLYTKDDVRAICEEVVGENTPCDGICDDGVHIGENNTKNQQRQSIDSIIDKWGK